MVPTPSVFGLLAAIGIVTASPLVDVDGGNNSTNTAPRLAPNAGAAATPSPSTPSSPAPSPSTTPSIDLSTLPTQTRTQLPTTLTNCGTTYQANIINEYLGLTTDLALQCQCFASVNSWLHDTNAPTRTLTTLHGTSLSTFTMTGQDGKPTVTSSELIETDTVIATTNFIAPGTDLWIGSAASPCCYSCTIAASTVELFFFPATMTVANNTPAPVTSFVSNSVTFQSPSVYIGFSALSAYDYCGKLGKEFVNTTMAFNPDELSSITFATLQGDPVTFGTTGPDGTLTQLVSTPIVYSPAGSAAITYTDLERNCSTIAGYRFIPGLPVNGHIASPDPCHPTIVVPDRVKSLDPAWAGCKPDGIGGFYDPPSALRSVTATRPSDPPPASPTPAPPPVSSTPAKPSSTPPPPPQSTAAPPPPPPQSTAALPPPPPPQNTAAPPPVSTPTGGGGNNGGDNRSGDNGNSGNGNGGGTGNTSGNGVGTTKNDSGNAGSNNGAANNGNAKSNANANASGNTNGNANGDKGNASGTGAANNNGSLSTSRSGNGVAVPPIQSSSSKPQGAGSRTTTTSSTTAAPALPSSNTASIKAGSLMMAKAVAGMVSLAMFM